MTEVDARAIARPGAAGNIAPYVTVTDTSPRLSGPGRPQLLVALLLALVGAYGDEPRIPTQARVVRAIETTPTLPPAMCWTLGAVLIDIGRDEQIYPGRGSPRIGDLLIVGHDGQGTWYLVLPSGLPSANARPRFPLAVKGVDRGDAIDLTIEVRLPKSGDVDRGPDTDGQYNEQPDLFWVDETAPSTGGSESPAQVGGTFMHRSIRSRLVRMTIARLLSVPGMTVAGAPATHAVGRRQTKSVVEALP